MLISAKLILFAIPLSFSGSVLRASERQGDVASDGGVGSRYEIYLSLTFTSSNVNQLPFAEYPLTSIRQSDPV